MNRSESANTLGDVLVLVGQRRVAGKIQIPILRMVMVGETAFDQSANEVQSEGRMLIGANQSNADRARAPRR